MANADALYGLLLEHSAMDYFDAPLEAVVEHGDWHDDGLYRVAEWLVTGAPDREPIKIGIAVLGIFQGGEGEREPVEETRDRMLEVVRDVGDERE